MSNTAPISEAQLSAAAECIRDGRLVGMPTETVYGLAGNAFDEAAVSSIFQTKARPRFDPLIVHIAALADLSRLTVDPPGEALRLAEALWPGPITLVLRKTDAVGDLVTAGLPTVAVRMPGHPAALALIRRAGVPLAAPSANRFAGISPTTADHVRAAFSAAEVPIVLDGGPCEAGVESTVIAFAGGRPTILRPGAVTRESIERIIGPVNLATASSADAAQSSPGMSRKHYAPRTPMRLVSGDGLADVEVESGERVGLLAVGPVERTDRFAAVEVLSPSGDLAEAAARLFAAMRRLDDAKLDCIVAVLGPDRGLGLAINDRLRRAAAD